MNHNDRKQLILQTARTLKTYGYRAFIAERGTYCFYTNTEGTRVVSIGVEWGCLHVTGNYKSTRPLLSGRNWLITEMIDYISENQAEQFIAEEIPQWVKLISLQVAYTTLDEYLNAYKASKFVEV